MKKLLIIIAAIALIAVLAVGTTVLAKGGEDNPVDQWQILIDKVNGIWDILGGTDENVQAIGDQIDSLTTNLNEITGDVAVIKNSMIRIESGEGSYEVPGNGTWSAMEVELDQVAHVTLTAAAHYFGAGDVLFIRLNLPGLGPTITVLDGDGQTQTVEFAASTWGLHVTGNGGETISYAYTITYQGTE